jgi:dUTP pyrophosphatase
MQGVIGYKRMRKDEVVYAPDKRVEDSDYDLRAAVATVIQPGQIVGVQTNLIIDFPAGWEGKIEDKSGLARDKGVHILGGVIDNGYTGEIIILVANLGRSNVTFDMGNKVAQMKVRPITPHFTFKEAELVKESERGSQGFGSTGV